MLPKFSLPLWNGNRSINFHIFFICVYILLRCWIHICCTIDYVSCSNSFTVFYSFISFARLLRWGHWSAVVTWNTSGDFRRIQFIHFGCSKSSHSLDWCSSTPYLPVGFCIYWLSERISGNWGIAKSHSIRRPSMCASQPSLSLLFQPVGSLSLIQSGSDKPLPMWL